MKLCGCEENTDERCEICITVEEVIEVLKQEREMVGNESQDR